MIVPDDSHPLYLYLYLYLLLWDIKPTSLLESLGAEIVRILDLVTHSNNFDFLDKIQNLSEYIFRGDSLSRNHFFTHSLTHSLTDKS